MRTTGAILLAVAMAAPAVARADMTGQAAPEIEVPEWINARPATLQDYRGCGILLEFWGTH